MKMRSAGLAVVASALLCACVTVPTGPSVMVLPGPTKSIDQFNADNWNCQQYARAIFDGSAPAQAAANSAAAGTLLGAAAGAIIGSATGQAGQGAAIGAGTGLLFGSAAGSNAAGYSYYEGQRQYDIAYMQCMYARGHQIPGRRTVYTGPASNYPPPNTPAPSYPPPNTPPPPGVTVPPRG